MKKILAMLLALTTALSLFAFAACGNEEKEQYSGGSGSPAEKIIRVYAPDGAPALAISKFIADGETFGIDQDVEYSVIAADTIQTIVDSADVIVMPVNLATKIYSANASDPLKMAGVITHGNLYLMAKDDITLEDLKGKVVGVANLANVPGLTFKAVLKEKGIEFETSDEPIEGKVALKGYTGQELMVALKTGAVSVGLMPEPIASKLVSTTPEFKFALDLQELYDSSAKAYPQAVVMVRSYILENYPEFVDNFASRIDSAMDWVKENTEEAAAAIASVLAEGVTQSINAQNLTAQVVDNCKIYFESASIAKDSVKDYIAKIRAIAPAAANEVGDDFYAVSLDGKVILD